VVYGYTWLWLATVPSNQQKDDDISGSGVLYNDLHALAAQ